MTSLNTKNDQLSENVSNEISKSLGQQEDNITNIWKRSPSYTNSYDEEWCRLFNSDFLSTHNIRLLALSGDLRNCQFRSVFWRIYLGLLGDDNEEWKNKLTQERSIYENLRREFIVDPRCDNEVKDDPLSLKQESRWNKYFRGQEVMKDIYQDVVRTFPETEFFHDNLVRITMINVLFCYSQTSRLSYRQGMHEILAPFIFVLHCDHTAYDHSREASKLSSSTRSLGEVLFDKNYLEHDAYSLFIRLMRVVETFYDVSPITNQNRHPIATQRSANPANQNPQNDQNQSQIKVTQKRQPPKVGQPFTHTRESAPLSIIGQRLSSIHDNLLRRHDLDLYLHLEQLEITSQMFGLRWLRLLFGREFTLQDLLLIWDVVFAVGGDSLILIDHIYVSMLIHIRHDLLDHDFAACLTRLMRYPSHIDVVHIVDCALHLLDPNSYDKPIERPLPTVTITNKRRRQQRKERNKTIVGIETIANRFSNFVGGGGGSKNRPLLLKYESPVADSAPVTPTNEPEDQIVAINDSDSLPADQHQLMHLCVGMIDQALAAVKNRDLDCAVERLMRARGVLTGNLTLDRRTVVNELQFQRPAQLKRNSNNRNIARNNSDKSTVAGSALSRSASSNDINVVRADGQRGVGMGLSQEILVMLMPGYGGGRLARNVELKSISTVNAQTAS